MTCLALTLLPILPLFAEEKGAKPLYELTMKSIQGKDVGLKSYKGKVLLIINVASECGYTQQYKGLQALHDKYGAKGLAVIGVPSNEFGSQEPGSNLEITQFCKKNYGVTFDLMEKTKITGNDSCGLYQFLTSKENNPKTGGQVKWNFTKFLVGKEGNILARFEPGVEPDSEELINAIEKALK